MNHDLEMEKIILNNFGVAPQLHNKNIAITFNDNEIPNTEIIDHHCFNNDVKFSLIDIDKGEIILSMEFYKSRNERAFNSWGTYTLGLLHIYDPALRRIGIGTFYINKLKEYILKNDGTTISIIANPSNDMLKNESEPRVSIQELVNYYKSFSDEDIKIKVLSKKVLP